MRSPSLAFVASLAAVAALAACASESSEPAATDSDGLTASSLSCTYGSAHFDVATSGPATVGTLEVSGHRLTYTCEAASDGASALDCAEDPQTLHAGSWEFVVAKVGDAYTATLKRGGTSADITFTCAGTTPTIDAGPGPTTDASVDASDAGTAPSVASYTEVAPLIANACSGCHHSSFGTLDRVKANKTRMLDMITSGRMPKNNPSWKNSAEGLEVIDFLQHSPELQ